MFSNLDDSNQKICTLALHTYEEIEEQIQWKFSEDGER